MELFGGTGKSTIAGALAQAVARKQLKSLLIGLGSPDILPLILGLQPEPNITNSVANPSDDGLRASIQVLGDLHVIPGFPDIISEAHGDRPAEQKGSVGELVTSAAYSGYASIILDTPSAGIAPRAISAANTWLMVARPTIADAWGFVEAFDGHPAFSRTAPYCAWQHLCRVEPTHKRNDDCGRMAQIGRLRHVAGWDYPLAFHQSCQ